MRARAIDVGCRDRRGQAAGGFAALVLLLALTASWMLGRETGQDVQAGVSVEYFEPAASSRVGGVGSSGLPATGSRATTASSVRADIFRGSAGPPGLEAGVLQPRTPRPRLPLGLASLLTGPEVEAVELGHAEGDFVYRRGVGWCRYEPAADGVPGRFLPAEFGRLPEELRRRHPASRFPPRGGPVPETAGPSAGPVPAESGPWILEPAE